MKSTRLFAAAVLLCLSGAAMAQTGPTLSFTAETVTGAGEVVPKLTWSTTPAAQSCIASGATNWAGTKAAGGTVTLAAVAISGVSTYQLTCVWAGDRSATIKWLPPTQNTDGSALTNLAGFRVQYGRSATDFTESVMLENPAAVLLKLNDLTAGAWYFRVRAYNKLGLQSEPSEVASKTIKADDSATRTVTITVNPKPKPPSNLTAE